MTRFRWSDNYEPVEGRPMAGDEQELEELARMLRKLSAEGGAMSVVEMDGFVTGLALQPERVPASEWLGHVWGEGAEFENNDEALEMEAAVIRHCNGVIRMLAQEPEFYGPVLEVDEQTEAIYWKPWFGGFARAMQLRPGAWARIESSNDLDVLEALQVIQTLHAAANGTSRLSGVGLELLESVVPMLIGGMVRDLNGFNRSRSPSAAERPGPGVPEAVDARSEPAATCGCGSGRPYRLCCGAH